MSPSDAAHELPMFPLGSVLLPGMAMPLRVFEPRYRTMMQRVMQDDPPRFGVVLIERGSEVGGGDVRTSVGCTALVVDHVEDPDGQWSVLVVGAERLRVEQWLEDDPHPRAIVRAAPDVDEDDPAGDEEFGRRVEALTAETLDVARLAARLGGSRLPPGLELSDDPALRLYQLATIAPLGALDRSRVLAAAGLRARLAVLDDLVAEQRVLLEARDRFDAD